MSQRNIGPLPERTAPHAPLELPDGTIMSAARIDTSFWHFVLKEFTGTPLNTVGDKLLKDN